MLELGRAHARRNPGGDGPRRREVRPLLHERHLAENHPRPEYGRTGRLLRVTEEDLDLPRLDQVCSIGGVAGAKEYFARLELSFAHWAPLAWRQAAGSRL